MNQFSPSPRVSHLAIFKFFQKFAEIFAIQGAPPESMTPLANLLPVSLVLLIPVANLPPGVNDTGVIDTGGKKWDQYQAAEKI
jgi:hypothetical protein